MQSGIGASEPLPVPSAGNGESEAVKIEVLYVTDCPNHLPTVKRIQRVLAAESLRVPVHEVIVSSEAEAKALHFLGSPTVRINGNDVERVEGSVPGLSCRMYRDFSGVPSEDLLRRAIAAARNERRVAEKARPIAAVIAALSTISCCLPFGFLGAIGLAGAGVWLQQFRGWLLGLAALFLFVGLWQLYRTGRTCKRRSPMSVVLFWVAAVVVVSVIFFPQVIASVLARLVP